MVMDYRQFFSLDSHKIGPSRRLSYAEFNEHNFGIFILICPKSQLNDDDFWKRVSVEKTNLRQSVLRKNMSKVDFNSGQYENRKVKNNLSKPK